MPASRTPCSTLRTPVRSNSSVGWAGSTRPMASARRYASKVRRRTEDRLVVELAWIIDVHPWNSKIGPNARIDGPQKITGPRVRLRVGPSKSDTCSQDNQFSRSSAEISPRIWSAEGRRCPQNITRRSCAFRSQSGSLTTSPEHRRADDVVQQLDERDGSLDGAPPFRGREARVWGAGGRLGAYCFGAGAARRTASRRGCRPRPGDNSILSMLICST